MTYLPRCACKAAPLPRRWPDGSRPGLGGPCSAICGRRRTHSGVLGMRVRASSGASQATLICTRGHVPVREGDKKEAVVVAERRHQPAQLGRREEGLRRQVLPAREPATACLERDEPAALDRRDGSACQGVEQRLRSQMRPFWHRRSRIQRAGLDSRTCATVTGELDLRCALR